MIVMEREVMLEMVRRRCENHSTESGVFVQSGAVAIGEMGGPSMRS